MSVFLYGLVSTSNPELVRYIGVANNLRRRTHQHVSEGRTGSGINQHKNRWIKAELTAGNKITHKVLAEYESHADAYEAEKALIEEYKNTFPGQLTNIADGGLGGIILSGELGEKARAASTQGFKKYWTPERRKVQGELIRRLWKTEEYRSLNTQIKRDLWQTEEYRAAHAKGMAKAREEKNYLEKAAEGRRNSEAWRNSVSQCNQDEEARERGREYALKGWAVLDEQQRKDRAFKSLRTRYYNMAKQNGWAIPITDVSKG